MITDEYKRFKEIVNNSGYLFAFYKSIKYLLRFNFFVILKKIYKIIIFYLFKNVNKINLDNISINYSDLEKLLLNFNSDKSAEYKNENKKLLPGHNFHKFYEKNFNKLKDKKINILELGVLEGGSTAAFLFYFKKAKIYCIDLNYNHFKYKSKRINFFELNLRDKKNIKNFINKHLNYFDIIIDDASHLKSCILENLENFLPCLKKESTYIIEDYRFPEIYESKNDLRDEIDISILLDSIANRTKFESKIISNNNIKKLLNNKTVNLYKGTRNDSDIAFIYF